MQKLRIFASSNITFDYPGRIPREGKALSILPILKELQMQLFLFYILRNEVFEEGGSIYCLIPEAIRF